MSSILSENVPFQSSAVLVEKLAAVLPKGPKFGIYHLSTPPTETDALFHAPLGERPDRTYRECHFLSVTIDTRAPRSSENKGGIAQEEHSSPDANGRVVVFALEIFIFTTATSSTFFVSKADSSGYLHLLDLPKGDKVPIREVCSVFIGYLVEQRQRRHIQSVVTLFARAQSQYLFPRSVDNPGKHVLDDRGLVKWWCRVLDPLPRQQQSHPDGNWSGVKGYLIVPGLDAYETRAFLPQSATGPNPWTVGHPLEEISHYFRERGGVPPRCLVPQYPDDPKSRLRDELDEEAKRSDQKSDLWQSVKTLDQFWEMMSFRQECSSGRLTGFIWVVFNPNSGPEASEKAPLSKPLSDGKKKKPKPRKVLTGRITTRLPRIKTQQRNYLVDRPKTTPYYYWPLEGRGKLIVDESDYNRTVELLLQLDFSTLEKAIISSSRWIKEAGMDNDWRLEVDGQRASADGAPVHSLDEHADRKTPSGALKLDKGQKAAAVNVLGASLVRRKRKDDSGSQDTGETQMTSTVKTPMVNVLSAGLVRKKPKVA